MPDHWIREQARNAAMIEPFVEEQKRQGVISYGLSSYGYDARCADHFKVFTNVDSAIVDPKAFNPASFVDRTGPVCIIPPNSFALTHTIEYFRIPRDILVICLGKSTYARCRNGKARLPSKFPTPPRCRPKSTPARAFANSCSCRARSLARSAMPTKRGNTWDSAAWRCQECRPWTVSE
jgi:hypothetical protein